MKEVVMTNAKKQNPVIRLWPKTRVKLDVIAEHQERKINATVEALCNAYIKSKKLQSRLKVSDSNATA